MPVQLTDNKQKILEKILRLKKDGYLPTRYAKAIKDKYPEMDTNRIHNVANGRSYNAEIIDAILELAETGKAEQQLERLEKLFEN